MSEEQRIISACVEALRAARPYVVDGRGRDAERVEALVDAAIDGAQLYLDTDSEAASKP